MSGKFDLTNPVFHDDNAAREHLEKPTVESQFDLLKRGIHGTFHASIEAHLHCYLAEFDFRANTRKLTDGEHAAALLAGAKGKRLVYQQPREAKNA